MIYSNYQRNHVIIPGRENALLAFLNKGYKGMKHKLANSVSSKSEDALTWSCFDMLAQLPHPIKVIALDEMLEDAYEGLCNFKFANQNYKSNDIEIDVGKIYTGLSFNENTEVDASIEIPDKILFLEAKLYSSISLVDGAKNKTHDQIARKMRVGLDYANSVNKEFYFIFLDIAPPEILQSFSDRKSKKDALDKSKGKWKSAWWFKYYKYGRNKSLKPLMGMLNDIPLNQDLKEIADNMGWLTWSDLFKIVMRSRIMHKP